MKNYSKRPTKGLICSALLGLAALPLSNIASAQTVGLTAAEEEARQERLEWFNDARFGMFIHWGLYAIPGGQWPGVDPKKTSGYGEWIMLKAKVPRAEYEKLAGQFNPVDFDADAIVRLAKDSGMKYICITAKHHDGFAMFKSEVSDYNVVDATPFGRDPMKEMAAACAKYDIKLCFYYSHIRDWHHPHGYGNSWEVLVEKQDPWIYHNEKGLPQLRELLTNYGPIGMMWFDTPGAVSEKESYAYADLVRELQPNCLINGRINANPFVGDYRTTRDGQAPDAPYSDAWESITVAVPATWGFRKDRLVGHPAWKLTREVIAVASQGGNTLMNIGPDAQGNVMPDSQEKLRRMGEWFNAHGEAIYGTTGDPSLELDENVYCTKKDGKLYLHVLKWPASKQLTVGGLKSSVEEVRPLSAGEPLKFMQQEDELFIELPEKAYDDIASVIVVEYQGELSVNRKREIVDANEDGSFSLLAKDAATFSHSRFRYDEEREAYTDWSSGRDGLVWEANFENPGRFEVEVVCAADEKTGSFFISHVYVADQVAILNSRKHEIKPDGSFQTLKIGEIEITDLRTGKQVIRIDPRAVKDGNMADVKAVYLKPVAKDSNR